MSQTPVENEIKIPVGEAMSAEALLRDRNFQTRKPRVLEQNIILDDAAASLRDAGKLLRVRRAAERVVCTFKGPEREGRHKTREEREFSASDFDECMALFAGLGYRPSFFYEKYRTEFERPGEPGHVTLDETPIGCFLELEGEPDWIDRTAAELGFAPETWVTRSYATLYYEWVETHGGDGSAMRFNH